MLERLEHPEQHQHQRDQHVEDQPHHPPGVAVGEAREEVGPRQRTRIGVGHVDLDLADDDEDAGQRDRRTRVVHHVLVTGQVHLRGLQRLVGRHHRLQREEGEEGAADHLQRAGNNPARPRRHHRGPPAPAVRFPCRRQEAQEVHLLADLRDQRKGHRAPRPHRQPVELVTVAAAELGEGGVQLRLAHQHDEEGRQQQHHEHRLRPRLQAADPGDAVRDQRDHRQRTQQIPPQDGQPEPQLERQRHDRRLDGEEDEGEGGVDQRGDGRADVAEAGATGQQVHVHRLAGGVVADRQAGEEDHQRHQADRPHGVGEAPVQRDRAADGLHRQEGHRAQRGVGDARERPLAKAARRVAQRVVLQRLVGDPAVVLATDVDDALGGRSGHGEGRQGAGKIDGGASARSIPTQDGAFRALCRPVCAGSPTAHAPDRGAAASACTTPGHGRDNAQRLLCTAQKDSHTPCASPYVV